MNKTQIHTGSQCLPLTISGSARRRCYSIPVENVKMADATSSAADRSIVLQEIFVQILSMNATVRCHKMIQSLIEIILEGGVRRFVVEAGLARERYLSRATNLSLSLSLSLSHSLSLSLMSEGGEMDVLTQ